jgi:sarcosine oxidase
MSAYDVIVAGLGGMGSAAAAHLSARGVRVLGIEQFDRGHSFGASTGKSRIIRKAYFESPEYVPLLERSYTLWHQLQARTGAQLYFPTGLLTIGLENGPVLQGAREAAARYSLDVSILEAKDIRAKYPVFHLLDSEVGVYEADAGYVVPEATVLAHLEFAQAHGAELRFGTIFKNWKADSQGVTVTLGDGQKVRASRLVLTLGPWFAREMAEIGVRLEIQRIILGWFEPAKPLGPNEMPCFLYEGGTYPSLLYGFPDVGDGVKAAFHGHGPVTSPQGLDRDIDEPVDITPIANALNDLIPGAAQKFVYGKACMYSMTDDEHFVIDKHPAHPNVILAGGFSGHGFKFVPVVGEILAQLAMEGGTPHPIKFLSVKRFAP